MGTERRGVVRLIVATPDGHRVLARPNGLAGWTLPVVAVDRPFEHWHDDHLADAARVVGTPVEPVAEVAPGYWLVRAAGRVPASGRTWVPVDDADRLGADAAAVRRWVRSYPRRSDRTPG